jgi:gliding motility-associated-like protein
MENTDLGFIIAERLTLYYKFTSKQINQIFYYNTTFDSILWQTKTSFKMNYLRLSNIDSTIVLGQDLRKWKTYRETSGKLLLDTIYGSPNSNLGYPHSLPKLKSIIHFTVSNFNKNGIKTEDSKGLYDLWLVNIDGDGKVLWDRTLGGNFDDGLMFGKVVGLLNLQKRITLIETDNRNILLVSSSKSNKSGDKSENRRGGYDYWLLLLDSSGQLLADKTFGSNEDDFPLGLIQYGPNRYLTWGYSSGSKGFDRTDTLSNSIGDNWLVGFCIAPPSELNTADTSLCQGDSILLMASPGYRYKWSTGDTTAQVWVSKTDSYHVAIYGENGCNTLSDTAFVQFAPYPSAHISTHTDTNVFCQGDSIQLICPTGFLAYAWSNGDTTPYSWASKPGMYYLDLVSFPRCTARADSMEIYETTPPTAGFSILPAKYLCDSALATLADGSKHALTSLTKWYFGGAASLSNPTQAYYKKNGNYAVSQLVSNGVCADSAFDTLTIAFATTQAALIQMADTGGCAPDTVTFALPDTSIVDSVWLLIGPDTLRATGNYTHVFANEGNYRIVLKVSSTNGCTSLDSTGYRLYPQPGAAFALLDSTALCGEKRYAFLNLSLPRWPATAASKFTWTTNDSLISNTLPIEDTLHVSTNRANKLRISLMQQIGHCLDSHSMQLWPLIAPAPVAAAMVQNTRFCAPDTLWLLNQSTHADSAVWLINRQPMDLSGSRTGVYIDSASFLSVQLRAFSLSGCADSLSLPLQAEALAKPKAYFTHSQSGTCPPFQVAIDSIRPHIPGTALGWALNALDTFIGQSAPFSFAIQSFTQTWMPLRLVANNGHCSDTFTRIMESRPLPVAGIGHTDTAFCVPHRLELISRSLGADSLGWIGLGAQAMHSDTIVYQIVDPGTYNPSLVAITKHGCRDTAFLALRAYPQPDASFSFAPRHGCSPFEIQAWPTKARLPGFGYRWLYNGDTSFTYPDSFSFTAEKTHPYTTGHTLQLVVYNAHCSDSSQMKHIGFMGFSDSATTVLRHASVRDSAVALAWRPLPAARGYLIERAEGSIWQAIGTVHDTSFTDYGAAANDPRRYRVRAQDSCQALALPGNWARPMALTASLRFPGPTLSLEWQAYRTWPGGVGSYSVQQWNGHRFTTLMRTASEGVSLSTTEPLPLDYWIFRVVAYAHGGPDSSASWPAMVLPSGNPYIPNAFSPNHDGTNDLFAVRLHGQEPYEIMIFNRWGNLIFTGDESHFWDGTYQGKPLALGDYWFLMATAQHQLTGIITLIK